MCAYFSFKKGGGGALLLGTVLLLGTIRYVIHSRAIWVYMALWQAISNSSATRSIWLVRVPSKPISHSNGYHMHIFSRTSIFSMCHLFDGWSNSQTQCNVYSSPWTEGTCIHNDWAYTRVCSMAVGSDQSANTYNTLVCSVRVKLDHHSHTLMMIPLCTFSAQRFRSTYHNFWVFGCTKLNLIHITLL